MRLRSIPGKIIQLRRCPRAFWRPFLAGWFFRGQNQTVPCVVPGCGRLLHVPLQDFYDSYTVVCENSTGRDELDFFLKQLRPNEVFYDLGAYRGAFAAAVKMRLGDRAAVHVFDPIPGNIAAIRRICELNGFGGVKINQQAVGRGNVLAGNVSNFDYMFRATPSQTGAAPTDAPGTRTDRVEYATLSLDDYVARGETPPTLMKIDVEGFEWDVLQGGRAVLSSHHPRLWLEVHPEFLENQGQSAAAVLNLLREIGYTVNFHHDYQSSATKAPYHVWCHRPGPGAP